MAKHDRAAREKDARNLLYARKFRQLRCGTCGHRTSSPGRCKRCGESIRSDDYVRSVKREHR